MPSIEHLAIADSQRHEPKGASVAALDTVMHAVGNGTTIWKQVDYANITNTPDGATPVPDSVAIDVASIVSDFNDLLASLRAAGVIDT